MSNSLLLAHDFSDRSQAITAVAADLAWRLNLALTALHVISSDELESERNNRPPDSAFTDIVLEQLRARLYAKVAAELSNSPTPEFSAQVIEGEPHRTIPEYMQRHQPEFTCIGVRNRSRVGKLVFGSVPQAILLGGAGKVVAVPVGN